jgi:hypothetical protein
MVVNVTQTEAKVCPALPVCCCTSYHQIYSFCVNCFATLQVESLMQSFVAIQDTKDIVGAMSGVFTEGTA